MNSFLESIRKHVNCPPLPWLVILALLASGCGDRHLLPIIHAGNVGSFRAEADSFMRYHPKSPFKRDSSIHFHGLNWFPPSMDFRFEASLTRYEFPETTIVYGTRGEERIKKRYGYFTFRFQEKKYQLHVYTSPGYQPPAITDGASEMLMVWFTDNTTGKETYPVGRYVNIGYESGDSAHRYTIDFNKAYNPYCAYTPMYTCAVPTRDNALDFAIPAGEKKYHE